ncbi:MAG TPA: NAD-dependent epimerase/dehydratase family protein [Anaerolineae bacterium]|nr:NAD-dependent epimerase/dehydratase family protein [Anaerolineae bacterium]HIP69781.1 NAD-dependent epimerase/dehydratase family protein [Anaerolineae bacterium]
MILITGATGFLGHNLVPMLVQAGYDIRALVRPTSNTGFLEKLGVELAYTDDIANQTTVLEACQGCDQVIHAAGLFRFWGEPEEFWQTNVAGTTAVLNAALNHNVQRFIYISTIAVVGTTPTQEVIDENTVCRPQEPYQLSKLEAETRVLAYGQEGLPVIVLRPGAFYGPWGRYAFNRLFFEEPLRGWRIRVDGGKHITFPVFVPDVAQGIMLALDKGKLGEIYNISGRSMTHNEVNNIVSDLTGIGHWRMNIPSSMVVALARAWTALSRVTHKEPFYPINMAPYVFQDWHISTAKAEKELGFVPTPFEIGACQTLKWYKEQGILKLRRFTGD